MKRRFVLLKDSVEYKKGAIFEEMCTNGDQDFKCITEEFSKLDKGSNWTYPRHLVLNQYDWFEEITLFWATKEMFSKIKTKLGTAVNSIKIHQ